MIPEMVSHVFYAFLAGMLLNLMPCVLPVIPIKVRSLMMELGETKSSRILASLAMLSGTLAFFSIVCVLMTVFQMVWGEWFKSVYFTGGVSLFLLAGALVLFLDLPLSIPGVFYRAGGTGFRGAFITGFTAAVLSTPCSGPFLGAVLAWSLMQSSGTVFLVLASVGLGLAFPYMVLFLVPGAERLVRRLGLATLPVKYLFSLVLFSGFLFYFKAAVGESLPPFFSETLFLALLVVCGFGFLKQPGRWERVLNLLTVTCALIVTVIFLSDAENNAASLSWYDYDQNLVANARREGRPVLLDFTADWCINCMVLEKTVHSRARVIKKIQEKGVLRIKVDLTKFSEDAKKLLIQYGGVAIPHTVVISGGGNVVFRETGVFTESSFLKAMEGL